MPTPLATRPDNSGAYTSFPTRKGDGLPTWPWRPFDAVSESWNFAHWARPGVDEDPRERYAPTRQDVASFRRWDPTVNPYGPEWIFWRAQLIAVRAVHPAETHALTIADIVTMLDATTIDGELTRAAAFLRRLAGNLSLTLPVADDRDELERQTAWRVGDVLLKTHGLPRPLLVCGEVYPGGIDRDKFWERLGDLTERKVTVSPADRAAIVLALADQIERLAERAGSAPSPPSPPSLDPTTLKDVPTRREVWFGSERLAINAHADYAVLAALLAADGQVVTYPNLLRCIKPNELAGSVSHMTEAPQEVKDAVNHINKAMREAHAPWKAESVRKYAYKLTLTARPNEQS